MSSSTVDDTAGNMAAKPNHPVGRGILLSLLSAGSLGVSGPFAKALFDSGWTAGSVVLVRLAGAAVLLGALACVMLRGALWRMVRDDARRVLLYGLLAMAGAQACYFNAVRFLPVGVALLLQYVAPLLVVLWAWLVRGQRPTLLSLAGGLVALFGLTLVVEVWFGIDLQWEGVVWGLMAAVCQAGYFLISDSADTRTHPVALLAAGTAVGAVIVAVLGVLGALPMTFDFSPGGVDVAGQHVSWLVPTAVLILVSTFLAYLSGVAAISILGATRGSLMGILEVVFATLTAWALLGQVPNRWQGIGGCLILLGVSCAQLSRSGRGSLPNSLDSLPTSPGSGA